LTLLILCLSFLLFQSQVFQARGQAPPAGEAPEVGVFTAELRQMPVAKEYVGRIDATETVEVRARIEGFLDRQYFQDGSIVKQGDQLFLIDPRQYEAAVSQARANLTKAQADLASAKSNVEVAKAQADLVRDQATAANAEKDLARSRPLAESSAVSIQELDLSETKAKEAAEEAAADEGGG
jgi:multidrug efflux pump subunit AcrA (membrane-fusion protein)